ncbi:MAG: hypothetical protein AB1507_02650 [Bacillota bacterium]
MRRLNLFVSVLVVMLLVAPLVLPLLCIFSQTPLARVGNVRLFAARGVPPEAQKAALSELRHLAATLPTACAEKWRIRLAGPCYEAKDGSLVTGYSFPARGKAVVLTPCGGMLGPIFELDPSSGRTLTLKPAEPAVPCYVAATITHEIGHLVRFCFLSEEEFDRYLEVRGWHAGIDPEELFAEDFRWLFGSETARQIAFQPSGITPPGEKERMAIVRAIPERGCAGLSLLR